MKKFLLFLLIVAGITATAQVKVGNNPTNLAANAKFQVEGSTGAQTVILDNGNVGLGTTAPNAGLQVANNSILIGTQTISGLANNALFPSNDAGDSRNLFRIDAYNNDLGILGDSGPGASVGTTMSFGTSPAGSGSAATRLKILSNGNVGIGTTAPAAKLDVAGNVKIADGTQGSGKVLTSDANGVATWQTPSASSSTEPWFNVATGTGATTNTGDAYLMGKVMVGANTPVAVDGAGNLAKFTVSGQDALINGITLGKGSGQTVTNTALGNQALWSNASLGNQNVAVGYNTLKANTTGAANTALGAYALRSNIDGYSNVAVGSTALMNNTTGFQNTSVGVGSLDANTTGNQNVALGYAILRFNTSGSKNIGIGYYAGDNITTGSNNILIGNVTNASAPTASNEMNIGNLVYGNGMTGAGAGNVGIGTNAPADKLHIYGNNSKLIIDNGTNATSEIGIVFKNGDGSSSQPKSAIISKGYNSWKRANMHFVLDGAPDDGPYDLNTDTKMFIAAESGNVGIGTTAPAAKLDVNGTSWFGVQRTASDALWSLGNNIMNVVSPTKMTSAAVAAPEAVLRLARAGTSGVVWNQSAEFRIGSSVATSNASTQLDLVLGNGGTHTPNTSLMTWLGNGNVGVGTTTPAAKLDVAGNVKIADGTQGSGKVLTSDANGVATWQTPSAASSAEPWFNVATGTGATTNTGDAYLMGKVMVGANTPVAVDGAGNLAKFTVSGQDALINGITLGKGSGQTVTNTALGNQALWSNASLGNQNVAVGYNTLKANTTGAANTALGAYALRSNIDGYSNVAVGSTALMNNTTGFQNTSVGVGSLEANTTGNQNVALGYAILRFNTSGSKNIGIGYYAGDNITTGSNNICIGASVYASSATATNEVTLGNSSNNSYRMYAASWTNLSDRRLKHDIKPMSAGLDFLMSLKPTEYVYNNADHKEKTLGFVAQDVQESLEKFGMKNYNLVKMVDVEKGLLGLNTTELISVTTKAIQELKAQVDALKAEVEALKAKK